MSPTMKVAKLLRIDERKARNILMAIQRQFPHTPSFEQIARAFEILPPEKHSLENIVEWLSCEWPDLKVKQKSKLAQEKDLAPRNPRGNIHIQIKSESFSPSLKHDPRSYLDGLEKCPHGNIKGRKCYLCDPVGYKFYHGDD